MSKKPKESDEKSDIVKEAEKDIKEAPEHKTEAKSNPDKSKSKKTKLYLIVGISAAVLLLLAILLITVLTGSSNMTAAKLINSYAKDKPYIEKIIELDDPDGLAGNDNEYATKSSWDDSRLDNIIEDHAGTVEVFKNEKDAEIREWYLDKVLEKCTQHISAQKYGKAMFEQVCGSLGYGTTYRNKNVILRLSRTYSVEQISEYKSGFNDIVKKYKTPEVDIPSDEKIASLKEQKEEKLEQLFSQQEEEMKSGLDGIANDMNNAIDTAMTSLEEAALEELKENLAYVKTIPYFSDKISTWEQKITEISDKITQNKADEARRAEEAERAKKTAKTRTFSAGTYTVGTDIDSGVYNITAVSGRGNCFVYNSSDRLQINEMMSSSGGNYYITNYSNAYLGTGYKIEITSTLTLRFEAVR